MKRIENYGKASFKAALQILLALSIFLSIAMPAAQAEEARTVRVGYFYLTGYHEIDAQGRLQGYGYDLLQKLRLYNDWHYDYIGYEQKWNEGFKMLERGEIDLITGVRKFPDRLEKFAYSNNPIGRSASVLVVREDDLRFASGDYKTYQGMRVGALAGSITNLKFDAYAKEKGFNYTIRYYEHMPELLQALRVQKDVDAILTTSMRYMETERVLDQFDSDYLYAIVKKGNERLLAEVNKAIYKMDYINPMWRQDLYTKYYTPRKGNILPMTDDEFAYRELLNASDRRLKVLVNPDRRPYSYLENGEFKGIFPALAKEMARRSGVKYEYIPVQTRNEYFAALRTQQADIVLDMPGNNYQAEKLGYKLSEPLLNTTLFAVKLRSQKGKLKKVALVKSLYDYGQVPDFVPQNAEITRLDSFAACIEGVLDGKYDATYMYAFQAQDAVSSDAGQRLTMAIVPNVQLRYCVGINAQAKPQLASIVNKSVASVKANYLEQLIEEASLVQVRPTLLEEIIHDPWAMAAILFVLVAIISLVAMLRAREQSMELISKKNEQLQEQQELLSHALEQAEESSKAKSVFLNSVSHDIRTPMNAIMGFAKLAEEQAVNPETRRYLEKILLSGKSLLSLINDVLDMSSIENGKLKVHEERCDLAELLKNIHEILQPAAKEKQLQFLLDASRIGSRQVFCDKVLLQRVLLNCLSNSIKYTDAGGIVSLRAEQKGPAVNDEAVFSFRISDSGIGMSKEFLKKVFEPFARERDTTASGIQGTGLGLTITKNIVELLGGKILVESEAGKGTIVYVDLGLKLVPEAPKDEVAEAGKEQLELKGKHVLLVDDVELNREIAQMMLEKAGCEVDTCVNGQEAVDYMAQAPKKKVDFVLMDLMMPVMDGLEATRLIRRLPDKESAQTLIIALTANAMNETKQEIVTAGMNGMLNKPFDVKALKQVLAEVLRQK